MTGKAGMNQDFTGTDNPPSRTKYGSTQHMDSYQITSIDRTLSRCWKALRGCTYAGMTIITPFVVALTVVACPTVPDPDPGAPDTIMDDGMPSWYKIPHLSDDEFYYFAGMANDAADSAKAESVAVKNALVEASYMVGCHVSGLIESRDINVSTPEEEYYRSDWSASSQIYTENFISGNKITKRQLDSNGQKLYVQIAIPREIINPNPQEFAEILSKQALRDYQMGQYRGVARSLECVYWIEHSEMIEYPEYSDLCVKTGNMLLDCYERLMNWHRGKLVTEKLLRDFSDHQGALSWRDRKKYFNQKLMERMQGSSWEKETSRLERLFERNRKSNIFKMSLIDHEAKTISNLDRTPANDEERIRWTLKSADSVWLTLLWLDGEGLYFAFDPDYITLDKIQRYEKWDFPIEPLMSSTVPGEVVLLALASTENPKLEFEPIHRADVEAGKDISVWRLAGLIDQVEAYLRAHNCATDLDRFRVTNDG